MKVGVCDRIISFGLLVYFSLFHSDILLRRKIWMSNLFTKLVIGNFWIFSHAYFSSSCFLSIFGWCYLEGIVNSDNEASNNSITTQYSIKLLGNLQVQSCKLYNNKYLIASTQITNTEIFTFIAVLVFKLLSCKVLFISRKDNRKC